MPYENLSPGNREAALYAALRGRRLIFEIGLDEDTYESTAQTFRSSIDGELHFASRDLRRYPATLVVLLASAGALHYREGDLWSCLGLSGPKAVLVGQAFNEALRSLRLETFEALVEEERALRYLTPILAHGGIPRYCLPDFFRLLVRTIRNGSTDPQEILSLWENRKGLTQGVDKPAIRFILYGGEPATDFLQRCVDLVLETRRTGHVPSAVESGLPQNLVDAFAALQNETGESVARDILPRPYVQLDPWDGLGPTLELPPAETGAGSFEWRLRDDRNAVSYRGSHSLKKSIRLNPARRWEIEARAEDREPRTFIFDCFDAMPVMFFDPSTGRLLRSRDQLRIGSVWALHSPEVTLSAGDASGLEHNLVSVEELPQPCGAWSRCLLSHYNLADVKHVVVRDADNLRARVSVTSPALRPILSASLDPMSVTSSGGAAIYSQFPTLTLPRIPDVPWERWHVIARTAGETHSVTADALERSGGSLSLKSILHDWVLQPVHLSVRGPLGSDLTAHFAVVPGLAVERPEHVLLPRERCQVRLRCDREIQLGAGAERESVVLQVGEHVDHVHCRSHFGSNDLTLVVPVSRVRWAVNRIGDTGVTTGSESLLIDSSEIAESAISSFVVTTGAAEVPLRLTLRAGPNALQESDWTRTSPTGRLFFDLARFRDTVTQGGHSSLEFVLEVGTKSVQVARLVTTLQIENIQAKRTEEGGRVVVECRFTDRSALKNREVRLWSLDRPWTDSTVVTVPDGSADVVVSDASTCLPAGRYLMEVALSDPWNGPTRPSIRSANSAVVTLGRRDEIEEHRAQLVLRGPLGALELAIATGRAPRPLTSSECFEVAGEAVEAACWQLASLGRQALNARSFHYLVGCFANTSEALLRNAARAIECGQVKSLDLLRLAIAVIPLVRGNEATAANDDRSSLPLSDSALRSLWSTCPPLATLYDTPRAVGGNFESIERTEEFLGVRPGAPVPVGAAIGVQEWQLSADWLKQIHGALELKPARLFDLDALADANFEWLLAEREGRLHSAVWCQEHSHTRASFLGPDHVLQEHLVARRPRQVIDKGMELSELVLGAAIHVVTSSPLSQEAAGALLSLVDTVPRLVSRDLTLAVFATTAPVPDSPVTDGAYA
jgi:hypothetical protein